MEKSYPPLISLLFLLPLIFIPSVAFAAVFGHDLKIGMIGSEVQTLQKFLNMSGFTVAQTGGGSPGNETMIFGGGTRAALTSFQKSYQITPAQGYFGPLTRERANTILDAHPDWTATLSGDVSSANVIGNAAPSTASSSTVTVSDLESEIQKLRAEIEKISNQSANNFDAIAMTNRGFTGGTISGASLTGITTNSGTISGGTISGATITNGSMNSGIVSGGTIANATNDQATVSNTVTGLTSLTTPHSSDVYPIVDMSGTPTGKKITDANIGMESCVGGYTRVAPHFCLASGGAISVYTLNPTDGNDSTMRNFNLSGFLGNAAGVARYLLMTGRLKMYTTGTAGTYSNLFFDTYYDTSGDQLASRNQGSIYEWSTVAANTRVKAESINFITPLVNSTYMYYKLLHDSPFANSSNTFESIFILGYWD